jgi:dynein heavy chain
MIFDGPVDTLWVENLNTVFDDNKTLCLSNGQRIKIQQNFKIIFEVSDLDQASPATVSRCGMIYVDSNQLGWKPIVNQWYGNFVVEHLSKKTNSKVES